MKVNTRSDTSDSAEASFQANGNDLTVVDDQCQEQPLCTICWNNSEMVHENVFKCPDHHQEICHDCLVSYIIERINSGNVSCMVCVTESCHRMISASEVAVILQEAPNLPVHGGTLEEEEEGAALPDDRERQESNSHIRKQASALLRKYERISARQDPSKFECPQPSCNHISEVPESMLDRRYAFCEECQVTSCRQCGRKWGKPACKLGGCHAGDAKMQRWLKNLTHDARRCPKCRTAIQKTGGCLHMTCTNCRYEFMWCCKQAYGSHKGYMCPYLQILKHRHRAFGPAKPVRAITKGTACTFAVLGTVVGGVVVVSLGTCATVVVLPWALVRRQRSRWRHARQQRQVLHQIRQTQEQLAAMATMQEYQIDLQQEIQKNIFSEEQPVPPDTLLDAGLFFTLDHGNIEPVALTHQRSQKRFVSSGSLIEIFGESSNSPIDIFPHDDTDILVDSLNTTPKGKAPLSFPEKDNMFFFRESQTIDLDDSTPSAANRNMPSKNTENSVTEKRKWWPLFHFSAAS